MPFSWGKTPSFNVNADKGFYHCFGCGKSGDVIDFIKDYKQVGFVDAVKDVASFAGITLNIENDSTAEKDNPHAMLYDINNQAARLYNIVLTSTEIGEKARLYLEKRGITSEIIKQFNIGLAPDENDFILKISLENLMKVFKRILGFSTFQVTRFSMLFKTELCFHSKMSTGMLWDFQAENGKKMIQVRQSISIQVQQKSLINLTSFIIWIEQNQLFPKHVKFT